MLIKKGGRNMKKWLCFLMAGAFSLMLLACAEKEQAAGQSQWDCSVTYAGDAVTYSDKEIVSDTGILAFQNRNDFKITVHLLGEGQDEQTFETEAGGVTVFYQAAKQQAYTIGIQADVDEGTVIELMVYDGERAEAY